MLFWVPNLFENKTSNYETLRFARNEENEKKNPKSRIQHT